MNVALVYDRVNKIGGAERILSVLHELFPEAPLYTSVYDPGKAPWAQSFDVRTTFLQYIPFAKNHHEWFAWATPFAFNTLSFDGYDMVISITSAEAKGIITKPGTMHLCYCLTPTRYLWSAESFYKKWTGFGVFHVPARAAFQLLLPTLKCWDRIASFRPDAYVAISESVKTRIRSYYGRHATHVIYPPVNTDTFVPSFRRGKYFLTVTRLVPYKRVDIIIDACNQLRERLIVIGSGTELSKLKKRAGPTVQIIPEYLTDKELLGYYQDCRAFLYAAEEEFGIVVAEAQSCGKPVIAYKGGGVGEIVIPGTTGILYNEQSSGALTRAMGLFKRMGFRQSAIRKNALRFSTSRFKREFLDMLKAVKEGNV